MTSRSLRRSRGRRAVLWIAGTALAVAVLAVMVLLSGSGESAAGKPAPPLPSAVLHPPRVSLGTLRGHPTLVNFWASWCEPCREEAPRVAALSRSLPPESRLVGVDYTDGKNAALSFIARYHWSFPILADPDGIYGARYRFSGLPTTVAIDAKGKVVEVLQGPQSLSQFRQALAVARNS
jgi:cytochrome c biogenesis protein CcmG/thiol:disulfide interchange protein DsbE